MIIGKGANTRTAMLRALEEDWPVVHIYKSEDDFNYSIFLEWATPLALFHNEDFVIVDRSVSQGRGPIGISNVDFYFAMISFRNPGMASMFKLTYC